MARAQGRKSLLTIIKLHTHQHAYQRTTRRILIDITPTFFSYELGASQLPSHTSQSQYCLPLRVPIIIAELSGVRPACWKALPSSMSPLRAACITSLHGICSPLGWRKVSN